MRRCEIVAVREDVHLFPRQAAEKILRQLAQERVAQTVNAFEVLKEENQPFEVRRGQLAVDAVERRSDGMGNMRGREIFLQLIDIIRERVKEKTGVLLESEVRSIPYQPEPFHE